MVGKLRLRIWGLRARTPISSTVVVTLHSCALSDPLDTDGKEQPNPSNRVLLQLPLRGQEGKLEAVRVSMYPPATPRQLQNGPMPKLRILTEYYCKQQ